MGFVIHWHESAMELHVFPILIPPSHFITLLSSTLISKSSFCPLQQKEGSLDSTIGIWARRKEIKIRKEGNVTLWVELFGLIQCIVVATSEHTLGNEVLDACKSQSEFCQLGRTGRREVVRALGLYNFNHSSEPWVSKSDDFSSWSLYNFLGGGWQRKMTTWGCLLEFWTYLPDKA